MSRNFTVTGRRLLLATAAIALSSLPDISTAQLYEEDAKAYVLRALESEGRRGAPAADGLLVMAPGGRLSEQQRAVAEARANALIEIYKETDDPEIKRRALRAMTNGGLFAPASVRATLADLGAELCTTSNDGRTVFSGVKLVSLDPPERHIPALMAALRRIDYAPYTFDPWETLPMMKGDAILTLGRCGQPAIPALTEAFDHADEYGVSKLKAAAMLCRVGSRTGIPYLLDAAGLSGSEPSDMAIMYLPYAWPLLTPREKRRAETLLDRLLEHENIVIRSMAARRALKCDKDRFAQKVQMLYSSDPSEHVRKTARQALMDAGLIEKDKSTLFGERVADFFQQRRKE